MNLFNKKETFYIITDKCLNFEVDHFVDKYAIGLIDIKFGEDIVTFKFQAKKNPNTMRKALRKAFGPEMYIMNLGNHFIVSNEGLA